MRNIIKLYCFIENKTCREGCCGCTSIAWGMPTPIGEDWSSGTDRRTHLGTRVNRGEGARAMCVTHSGVFGT